MNKPIASQLAEKIRNISCEISALRPANPAQSTLFNFGFGALYAYKKALESGCLDQCNSKSIRGYVEKISMRRARQVGLLARDYLSKDRSIPNHCEWLAGFYYNDALIRLDVCYEQLARYAGKVKRDLHRDKLEELAISNGLRKNLIQPWWKKVREDVNTIKHQSIYTTEGPKLDPAETATIISNLIQGIKQVFHKGGRNLDK